MNKIRKRITVARFFQVLTFLLSFPLLIALLEYTCRPLREDPTMEKWIAWMPVIAGVGLLLIVLLSQLVVRGIAKKNRFTRATLIGLLAAILIIGPVVGMETAGKNGFEKVREDILKETGEEYDIGSYYVHATDFKAKAKEHADMVNAWITRYNLDSAGGANIGGLNTDRTYDEKDVEGGKIWSEAVYNEEDQAYYSANGLFSDGYIFSIKQAKKIIYDYYTLSDKITSGTLGTAVPYVDGDTADMVLRKAITALKENPSSDWNKYKQGKDPSAFDMHGFEYIMSQNEWDLAYGENGSAKRYYIHPERLDDILGALGDALSQEKTPQFKELISGVKSLVSVVGIEGIEDYIAIVDELSQELNSELTLQKVVDIINKDDRWETKLYPVITKSGATEMFGVEIPKVITTDFLYAVLEELSFYIAPTTYPVFYFIENPELKAYAYAKYYAQNHGAKVGSVLIGRPMTNAPGAEGKVGKITLDSAGQPQPSREQVMNEIRYLDYYDRYAPTYYPLLTIRAVLLKFGAVAFLMLMATYLFTGIIDRNFKKLRPIEG